MPRPAVDEYDPYFATYIDQTVEDEIDEALIGAHAISHPVLFGLRDEGAAQRYAPDKWSIKQIMLHLIDTERVFCTRALAFARGDATPLPGFDHDAYAVRSGADDRKWLDLLVEFDAVRDSTRSLFRSFDEDTLASRGTANDLSFTARAIGFIIAGHERHHIATIQERYLA